MKRRAFTLVELLVVISIIGLLSSIAVVNLGAARNKAKRAKAQAEVRMLFDAINRYNIDNGSWPGLGSGNLTTAAEWNSAWKTGYIDVTINPDPWGTYYFYDGLPNVECAPGNSSVCSAGPDAVFSSWNRADMTVQGDDICIYFDPMC